MTVGRVREVTDEACDVVVDYEGKVRLRCLQLILDLRGEGSVGGKCHLVGGIERGCFDGSREARALFQGRHLERVDRIQEMVELGIQEVAGLGGIDLAESEPLADEILDEKGSALFCSEEGKRLRGV